MGGRRENQESRDGDERGRPKKCDKFRKSSRKGEQGGTREPAATTSGLGDRDPYTRREPSEPQGGDRDRGLRSRTHRATERDRRRTGTRGQGLSSSPPPRDMRLLRDGGQAIVPLTSFTSLPMLSQGNMMAVIPGPPVIPEQEVNDSDIDAELAVSLRDIVSGDKRTRTDTESDSEEDRTPKRMNRERPTSPSHCPSNVCASRSKMIETKLDTILDQLNIIQRDLCTLGEDMKLQKERVKGIQRSLSQGASTSANVGPVTSTQPARSAPSYRPQSSSQSTSGGTTSKWGGGHNWD